MHLYGERVGLLHWKWHWYTPLPEKNPCLDTSNLNNFNRVNGGISDILFYMASDVAF